MRTQLNRLAWSLGFFAALALSLPVNAQHTGNAAGQYDADESVAVSQAAVGLRLANLELTDSEGQTVHLADYFGRPVLVSMVFTSCYHVCPAITRHLASAVEAAREALGEDRFQVLTIGFDTANDSPDAMRQFARAQKVEDSDWAFLSGDADTMKQLTANVGFVYFPSPRGFDHINQVTVVDRDGVIYRQVYGADFDLPWLVEPLKQLVLNRPEPAQPFVLGFFDRVRLFCTVYDPSTGRYRFDYSLFVQIAVGALFLLAFGSWLVLEIVRARRRKHPAP
jgi:protein SCO1/2